MSKSYRNVVVASIAVLLLIGGFFVYPGLKSQYQERNIYPKLRAAVTHKLYDPASAQYRNERLTQSGILCGELNAKNLQGAYVGFRRFISGPGERWLEQTGWIDGGDLLQDVKGTKAFLESHIAVLEEEAVRRENNFKGQWLSEREMRTLAIERMFEKKWKEICPS